MASKGGAVTLRGRFKPGTLVRLVKVAHEGVLRPEGGELVAAKRVDEDGVVQFVDGVEVGGRYFISGLIDGQPVDVRARGNEPGDEDLGLVNGSVAPERQKLADGRFQDEVVDPRMPREIAKPDLEQEKPARPARKSTTAKSAKTPARKEK